MSGAILWSGLSYPWEGSIGELLEILDANVEDRVKQLPEWPESPSELYEYLGSLDGYLFPFIGGDVEVEMRGYSEERPEETKLLIELVLPDEPENDLDAKEIIPQDFNVDRLNADGLDEG